MFDRVLMLETSGKVGQVALAAGGVIVAEHRLDQAHRRASDLALATSHLLTGRDWKARELTAVIVGLGPGSYTGLRVGLASAKALAYATGCAFFGVETFAAMVWRLPEAAQNASVIGDALQGNVFHRRYERHGSEWMPATSLRVLAAADWQAKVGEADWVTGPAAGMFETRLAAKFASPELREPRPIDLLNVARFAPWAVTTDLWTAEPLYLRGSSAEEKAAAK
jgi:tRNA threonylcarbamoyladenosine biosynthesis protein TsaB